MSVCEKAEKEEIKDGVVSRIDTVTVLLCFMCCGRMCVITNHSAMSLAKSDLNHHPSSFLWLHSGAST